MVLWLIRDRIKFVHIMLTLSHLVAAVSFPISCKSHEIEMFQCLSSLQLLSTLDKFAINFFFFLERMLCRSKLCWYVDIISLHCCVSHVTMCTTVCCSRVGLDYSQIHTQFTMVYVVCNSYIRTRDTFCVTHNNNNNKNSSRNDCDCCRLFIWSSSSSSCLLV